MHYVESLLAIASRLTGQYGCLETAFRRLTGFDSSSLCIHSHNMPPGLRWLCEQQALQNTQHAACPFGTFCFVLHQPGNFRMLRFWCRYRITAAALQPYWCSCRMSMSRSLLALMPTCCIHKLQTLPGHRMSRGCRLQAAMGTMPSWCNRQSGEVQAVD